MNKRHSIKLLREGRYLAEVSVELLEDESGWSPYLSLADIQKLEAIRSALKTGNVRDAGKLARVYEITPLASAAE
ncbi:MAG: hypothetical protein WBP94_02035 [Rhodomicrobiaceae bacterium]